MRTRSSSNLPVESPPNPSTSNPKRYNRRRSKQPFILEESPIDTMADQRTMTKLLHAPIEGYAEGIMVPPILAEQFELKHSLINMMTSDQFFRLKKDNPHDHIRDVFVPVRKFTFPVDFVIVGYESDPRVPFILGRPFLRTARALIDVHGEEMILRDGDERLTLNMRHDTSSYSN
nr:reverse transcriptase domain-containing protein [Tanacetum cinerariifolium]